MIRVTKKFRSKDVVDKKTKEPILFKATTEHSLSKKQEQAIVDAGNGYFIDPKTKKKLYQKSEKKGNKNAPENKSNAPKNKETK